MWVRNCCVNLQRNKKEKNKQKQQYQPYGNTVKPLIMTAMKQIIESIKSNREELIFKYKKMARRTEFLEDGMKQTKLLHCEEIYNKLRAERADLYSKMVGVRMVIDNLTNELNHLGGSTETFQA